jgi:hypothetical protein
MVERRKQGRGWDGHFLGFWARLNCENMPVIPAWLVRNNLDDPRGIPYLLVWKDERHNGEIKEAVRLARYVESSNSRVTDNYIELKRTDGSLTVLRIVWRMLPRNGGHCCWSAPTATPRAATSTVGNGIVLPDGLTESGNSVGGAGLALDSATRPKVAICIQTQCFGHSETCRAPICGFLTCSRLLLTQQRLASVRSADKRLDLPRSLADR